MKKISTVVIACCALALTSTGCSSSSDGGAGAAGSAGQSGSNSEPLQLLSWWTGPGEAEALQALMDTYKSDYSGARVNLDSSVTADNWRTTLNAGIAHSPWDAFQLAGADMPQFRKDHPGDVLPVDVYDADPALKDAVIPAILASVTMEDGKPYGVVTGVHRNNSFLFNQQLFDQNGLKAPTSIDEFLSACKTLKKAGVTPVATTFQTWALRILFDEILAGTLGAQTFDDLVQGRTPPTDAKMTAGIKSAIATFGTVLSDYVDPATNTADYGWTNAADDVHDGKAAMLLHGDWDKGYMVHVGWTPGVDFGLSGPPGANDLFVYGADVFGLPAAAPHPDMAENFLSVVASKDGQIAFNKYKGATPVRTDVRDQLDDLGKASMDALLNAKVLSPSHANADWDTAIGAFAMDGDQDAMLAAYLAAKP